MATDPDPNETAATLARRRRYTIDVPGFFPVTYTRGEHVPQKHFEHVPGRDRRWFDKRVRDDQDASPDQTGDAPEASDE